MLLSISVVMYVLIMIPLGLYASRKVKSTGDYVLAGRSLPFYMALATVFATWFGSESILLERARSLQRVAFLMLLRILLELLFVLLLPGFSFIESFII